MRTFPYRHIISTLATLVALMGPRIGRAAGTFEPQLDANDNYSETYTAIADLDGGAYVQAQLNVSNLGVGDANGACRLLIVEPGQKAWTTSDRVDHDEWKATSDSLTISSCTLSASGGQTIFEGKLDKGLLKIVLAAQPSPREPPDSKISVDGKTFHLSLLVPWAKVDVTFAIPGRAAKTVTGFGYLDHSRGNTLPAQLATRWVRFRFLNGSDSTLLLARNLPDGGLRGWMWRQKEPFPRPISKLKLTRVDEKDQAKGYDITGAAGNLDFEIVVESQLYRYAPVEEYGVLGVLARSIVGNPVTRTYRATLSLHDAASASTKDAPPPLTQRGILEVQHVQ